MTHPAEFKQRHLCDLLEMFLMRMPQRQALRGFTSLFNKHWPDIRPTAERHPRLVRVVELHEADLKKRAAIARIAVSGTPGSQPK